MKFTLEITTENAAFRNDDDSGPAIGPEVARILRDIAGTIKDDDAPRVGDCGRANDANGNKVGSWRYEAAQ